MLLPVTAPKNTLEHGGTLILLSIEKFSELILTALLSPITLMTMSQMMETITTTLTTAVISTPANASGVVSMSTRSRTREAAVPATPSLLLKSLSLMLLLEVTVFTTSLSNKLLTADTVTTVVATVDGLHLLCALLLMLPSLLCLPRTTSTLQPRALARLTKRAHLLKSRLKDQYNLSNPEVLLHSSRPL